MTDALATIGSIIRSPDVISLVIFVMILSLFLHVKRKNVTLQKILYPLLYIMLYKTQLGLRMMDRIAKRFRGLLTIIGYCFVGFAFLGAIFMGVSIIAIMVKFFSAPSTTETGMALVLPLTTVPGLGFIRFWHWIISIFILAVVHEFGHGILMRVHKVRIKSSGFGFIGILAPMMPLAFVEQDPKEMDKMDSIKQYSIFAAGPMVNIVIAILLFSIFPFTAFGSGTPAPFEERMTEPIGFTVNVDPNYPAGRSGLQNGTLITNFNGEQMTEAQPFLEHMYYCVQPNETITLGNENGTYTITTTTHPDSEKKGYIGITPPKNVRQFKPEYKKYEGTFYWFKSLLRMVALLNFFIGLANLIPIFITDGAQMFRLALRDSMKNKALAKKIWYSINLLFVSLIIIGLTANLFK
ncbi:MAG: site-2 protease family protein [Nanoarchaeota archaeon]|nr:site-2 protease family protein [Nanoarchaeota archaeon]